MKNLIAIVKRDQRIYFSFLIILVIYCIFSIFTKGHIETPDLYIKTIYLACSLTLSLASITYFIYLIFKKEKRPLVKFLEALKLPFKKWQECLNLILIITLIALAISIYTDIKIDIPKNISYYLDPFLVKIDRITHFGIDPWRITHSIFSSPTSTAIINLFYNLWFFVSWVFLITFCCLYKNHGLRERTVISFFLCWSINGSIAATLFASVGPCFYDLFYQGSNEFVDLMTILKQQNIALAEKEGFFKIWALSTQNMLWEGFSVESGNFGEGISAMPSMHVSMATLMALATYSINKWLGAVLWVYMVIIMIGSVHLGWHYALDGYVGAIMTTGIWYAVKWVTLKDTDRSNNDKVLSR